MSSQMPTMEEVSSSLHPLRTGLNADGYDLEVTAIDDKVRLRVVALENACEECLVPREVMANVLANRLQSGVTADDIDIAYPANH